ISITRPRGRPPTPSAMSSPSDPDDTVSTSIAFCLPSRMIEPLPNARSICERAASSALVLSTLVPSTRRRLGWLITVVLLSWAASDPQSRFFARPRMCDYVHGLFSRASSFFVLTGESLTQAHPGRLKFSKPLLSAELGFRSRDKIVKMGIKRPETRAGLSSGSDERRQARGAFDRIAVSELRPPEWRTRGVVLRVQLRRGERPQPLARRLTGVGAATRQPGDFE